jgi:hypothetical protein
MRPIGLDDILGRERYGQVRDAARRRIIEHKRARRVGVGDSLSFVFEDRATVWYQTQEMLWVEHVTDLDAIRAELEVYNQLMPSAGDLAATLLIELRDQGTMREEFQRLLGLDRHVALLVGALRSPAAFEEGRQTDDKISAVQYVRFAIDGRARAALGTASLQIVVDHPSYAAVVLLSDATRASIVGSFLDEAVADSDLARVRGTVR